MARGRAVLCTPGGCPGRRAPARGGPGAAERNAGQVRARHRQLRLRQARRDDPDARRGEAAHGHPRAEGRQGRADPADAHAVQRHRRSPATPQSAHLGPILHGYDNATDVIVEGGYIRVVQDVRGKYGSEGDYVMNRPLRGPQNPTPVDHATDTYDTIDWLVKNIPESNGKVGILGISYDGFLPLMALVNPHPALKVAVPMNPMVDGWMGDDWFHNGAFRQQNMSYIYDQEAHARERGQVVDAATSTTTTCSCRRDRPASSAGAAASSRSASGARSLEHPELRRVLARPGRGQDPGGPAAAGAGDAGPQPLGPGGHLRRHRRLQGDRAEGHGQRQGLPGHGPVVPRPGDRRRQHARRAEVRQRHRAQLPPGDPAARSSTST